MNEKEIAENKVLPFLEKLGWSKQLITQYGKVPVQMGTEVKWADIVSLFVDENDAAIPYLVIEVKTKLDDLNEILAQSESYSKFLDTVYFAITDGVTYSFYQRIPTGGYIKINNIPVPDKRHLTVTQNTRFRPGFILCARPEIEKRDSTNQYQKKFLDRVDEYFKLITQKTHYLGRRKQYSLRTDVIGHYLSIKRIYDLVHNKIDSIRPEEFKRYFFDSEAPPEVQRLSSIMSYKRPNIDKIYFEIDNNFSKIKAFLRFIKEFKGDPEENLNRLFNVNDELHISGMGPFVVSQFLAGAHPRDYTIVEDRMVKTMKEFGLVDIKVRSDTAKGYLYINDICKKIHREIFSKKIEMNRSKLDFKIDEDFGLVLIHEFFWEYEEFCSFDVAELEETTDPWFEESTRADLNELADFVK